MYPLHDIQGIGSDPGYYYHATNHERAFDIMEEGLKPHRPWEFTDQSTWPDGSEQRRIYFSMRAEMVWQFAPEDGEAVILRVPIIAADFKHEIAGDVYARKPISAELIEFLGVDGVWYPLEEIE